ncbi:aminotransferase class I/II-fold pyridoxal phosphate-dependent enzyme [Geobacillus thermodenitrificans]|uniref:aminotransferase class I/II-fold pyridoxal phosphate-dependent enzyme n=1 Tax=Geobacillus thermodenitrificans TaxID=33940 RepID=UPI000405847F|nr:aminotransferase class I/II-fold pyridoxal phosphate-dependent enzyme [Geobacillus thermodenitrificans]ARA99430.1 hypothetical protein GD3902_16155 [Geobacillus thermodenitrificans]
MKKAESALIFNSGYAANIGVLIRRDDLVLNDERNHASLIDGIHLSKVTCFRYRRNDVDDESNLRQETENGWSPPLSSIWMERLSELVELKRRYRFLTPPWWTTTLS